MIEVVRSVFNEEQNVGPVEVKFRLHARRPLQVKRISTGYRNMKPFEIIRLKAFTLLSLVFPLSFSSFICHLSRYQQTHEARYD